MFHNERKLQLIRTSFFSIVDSIPSRKINKTKAKVMILIIFKILNILGSFGLFQYIKDANNCKLTLQAYSELQLRSLRKL